MGAVRRAWDLARGRFWHLLALMLLLIIFAQLIVTGPSALLGVLFQYISDSPSAFGGFAPGLLQTLSQALVGLATGLLYLPLQLCAITLVYFDLRVRREGFDLAWKAQSDNQEHSDIFTITQNAPKPEEGNWITGRELGYFALISIAIIALYALLFGLALALIALMFNSGFGL